MNKLYPIKSIVLRTARNQAGETYHCARLSFDHGGAIGIINVSLKSPNVLPKSWGLADGLPAPVINKQTFARFDRNLGKFIPCATAEQADQVDSLVGVGYAGVRQEEIERDFAVVRKDHTKSGEEILFYRRVVPGVLTILPFPRIDEEDGVPVQMKK